MATGAEFLSKKVGEAGDYRGRAFEVKPGAKQESSVRSGAPITQEGENPVAMMGLKLELLRGNVRKELAGQFKDDAAVEAAVEKAIANMTAAEIDALPRIKGSNAEIRASIKELAGKLAESVLPEIPESAIEDLREEAEVEAQKSA